MRSLLLVLSVLTLAVSSGCGRREHYCKYVAPRAELAAAQSLHYGAITSFFNEVAAENTNSVMMPHTSDELLDAAEKLNDSRFSNLWYLMVQIQNTPSEAFDLNDARFVLDLTNELRADYCGVTHPANRCINYTSDELNGTDYRVIAACQEVKTQAAADCVAYVTFQTISVYPEQIQACAKMYLAEQASCVRSVSDELNGTDYRVLEACNRINRPSEANCIRSVSRQTISVYPEQIRACDSDVTFGTSPSVAAH